MGPQVEFEDIATTDSKFGKVRVNKVRDRLNGTILKIGGTKYKLGFKGRIVERFQVMAQTDFFNDTILFESNQTEGTLLSTILHEIVEVLNKKYNLNILHETIVGLETILFESLVNNPVLLEELLKYARSYNK